MLIYLLLIVSSYDESPLAPLLYISSLEWGSEGYQLWVISKDPQSNTEQHDFEPLPAQQPKLLQLQFVKSALTVNPCTVSNNYH